MKAIGVGVGAGRLARSFEPGGGATVGNGMILSCVSHPGLGATATASGDGFKIFQFYVLGDADWIDDHIRRAIDTGYDAFCVTVDTDPLLTGCSSQGQSTEPANRAHLGHSQVWLHGCDDIARHRSARFPPRAQRRTGRYSTDSTHS